MDEKKHYTPPHLIQYAPGQVPERIEQLFSSDLLSAERRVAPQYTNVVDNDRRFVRVSDTFCELLGYRSEDLIGKRFDEITAPKTTDITTVFNLFKRLGYMHGLWMLVHRTGKRILIRYESWLRPDFLIETNIEVVDHLR